MGNDLWGEYMLKNRVKEEEENGKEKEREKELEQKTVDKTSDGTLVCRWGYADVCEPATPEGARGG